MADYAPKWSRFDGNDWTVPASVLTAVSQPPALASGPDPGSIACVAAAGGDDKSGLQYLTLDCSKWSWGTPTDIGTSKTDATPALALTSTSLACAYKELGNGSKGIKWIEYTASTKTWGDEKDVVTGEITQSGPALAYYQGALVCVYVGASNEMYWTRYNTTSSAWSAPEKIRENTSGPGLSLTVCASLLFCAHVRPGEAKISLTSFDGDGWSFDRSAANPAVDTAPGITTYNEQVYCLSKGNGTDPMNVSAFDGRFWSDVEQLPKTYTAALQPSVAAASGCLVEVHCTSG